MGCRYRYEFAILTYSNISRIPVSEKSKYLSITSKQELVLGTFPPDHVSRFLSSIPNCSYFFNNSTICVCILTHMAYPYHNRCTVTPERLSIRWTETGSEQLRKIEKGIEVFTFVPTVDEETPFALAVCRLRSVSFALIKRGSAFYI